MAQIERLGRISEQFLVARKCVFAWKMLRKWHKKQKKPLLGAKSLGRLFYQNNLPNMAAEEGFEPSQTESESGVLPLHNSAKRKDYYTFFFRFVNTFFTQFRCFRNTLPPAPHNSLQAGPRTPRSFSAQAPGRSFEESPRTRRWKPSARGFQTASNIRFPF